MVQRPPLVAGTDRRPPPGHVVRAAGASEEPAAAPGSERFGRRVRAGGCLGARQVLATRQTQEVQEQRSGAELQPEASGPRLPPLALLLP